MITSMKSADHYIMGRIMWLGYIAIWHTDYGSSSGFPERFHLFFWGGGSVEGFGGGGVSSG